MALVLFSFLVLFSPGTPNRNCSLHRGLWAHPAYSTQSTKSQCTASREKGEGNSRRWAERLHLPALQPEATALGPAFGERSSHMLAQFSHSWELPASAPCHGHSLGNCVSSRKIFRHKPQGVVLAPADKYSNYTEKFRGKKKSLHFLPAT